MIYLDNSATTRPFQEVAEVICKTLQDDYFNPSSMYAFALQAERRMMDIRERLMAMVKLQLGNVIFTSGGTEANNLAIRGLIPRAKGTSGHWVTSAMEHPSVLQVFRRMEEMGQRITVLPVSGGHVSAESLAEAIQPDTVLVSIMQVNNETGVVQDIAALGSLIKQCNPDTLFHVDGVQGFARIPMDMERARVDLYSLSAHKIHGPKGVGALLIAPRIELDPLVFGGGQEGGLRSGTENTPGIAGLGASVTLWQQHGAAWTEVMQTLKIRLAEGLQRLIPGTRVNGPDPLQGAPHIINLSFEGVRGEVLLHALEGEGILVSTGSACSSRQRKVSASLLAQGIPEEAAESAIRFSLSALTTGEEIDQTIAAVVSQTARLRRFRRK